MKNSGFILFVILLFTANANAQQVDWKVGFDGFTDNREYFNDIHYPQTMFGARLRLGGGIAFEENNNIYFGINYLHEFGADNRKSENIDYTLYYKYQNKNLRFYFGAFPRVGLLNYPLAILTDTLLYYKPNMEGVFLELFNTKAKQNVWVDWTGRQADFVRETFMAGTSGKAHAGNFFLENYVLLYHHAVQRVMIEEQHINDYLGFDVGAGYDLSSLVGIDSVSVSTHYLQSLHRDRGDGIMHKPGGIIMNMQMKHKFVGTNFMYYSGGSQHFYWGDAFYKANNYARWDIDLYPLRFSKYINCYFRWSFHFLEDVRNNSQQFYLTVDLDQLKFK